MPLSNVKLVTRYEASEEVWKTAVPEMYYIIIFLLYYFILIVFGSF